VAIIASTVELPKSDFQDSNKAGQCSDWYVQSRLVASFQRLMGLVWSIEWIEGTNSTGSGGRSPNILSHHRSAR
jgi:hypothetical protein